MVRIVSVGTRTTGSSATPKLASAPMASAETMSPPAIRRSPTRASSPRRRMLAPSALHATTRTRPSSPCADSRGTTAPVPGGTGAPVAIGRASPAPSDTVVPAKIGWPSGSDSALFISPVGTAKPSIAAMSHGGLSRRAATSSATIR